MLILKKLDRFNLLMIDINFEESDEDGSSSRSPGVSEREDRPPKEHFDYHPGEYFYEREKRRGPLFECEPEYPISLRYHAYKYTYLNQRRHKLRADEKRAEESSHG
jgi:hypothetical protein